MRKTKPDEVRLGPLSLQRDQVEDLRRACAAKDRDGGALICLFAGASGTGKTLAAETLAAELGRPLHTITPTAKYIGETEKNLARQFDKAAAAGAVLLVDEADALFGKRTEVKDSHDRYANAHGNYLLQKIEAYPGLVILTSNREDNLDDALQRRLRQVIAFAKPDP